MTARRIAIVGGGFSGAMLAARLAERGVASTLINRTAEFGPGLAYGTPADEHLLNVRSSRMSAIEGRPDDFVRWLGAHAPGLADPEGFAPRRLYGQYVADRLVAAEVDHPGLIVPVIGEATAIEADGVRLADGGRVAADTVVIATGNPPPRTATASDRVVADPWAPGALDQIGPEDDLVVLGAGLTMIDVVLGLQGRGWRGRAAILSRRGLRPLAHGDHHDAPVPPGAAMTSGPLSRRLAEARRLARAHGWRGVMEGLRPLTAALWEGADPALRGRFLRHVAPWWDIHRHRVAAPVAAAMAALEAAGRLDYATGRVLGIDDSAEGVALHWAARGGGERPPLTGRWLIDCTGPGHAPMDAPLTGSLIAVGRARLGPLGLGLDLDTRGRVVAPDGRADDRLYVLGPPARGAFWETTAVPDIRKRIEGLVGALAH